MPRWFTCPYLGIDIELTDEREQHILAKHEQVMAEDARFLAGALDAPDQIRRSGKDPSARLFIRWYDDVERGKYVTVVVVNDSVQRGRSWVVTAYVTDRPRRGNIEWQKG